MFRWNVTESCSIKICWSALSFLLGNYLAVWFGKLRSWSISFVWDWCDWHTEICVHCSHLALCLNSFHLVNQIFCISGNVCLTYLSLLDSSSAMIIEFICYRQPVKWHSKNEISGKYICMCAFMLNSFKKIRGIRAKAFSKDLRDWTFLLELWRLVEPFLKWNKIRCSTLDKRVTL